VPKTNIQIIDPTKHKGWDDLLLTNNDTTFFHTSGWCRVLAESYGYKPLYFTQIDNGKLISLIAVMEVNSFLTGKRGVSLPFSDQCEPIAKDQGTFNALFDKVVDHGQHSNWKTIELRGGHQYLTDKTSSASFLIHHLDLKEKTEKDLLSSFRDSTKRNIKKAIKQSVTVESSNSLAGIKEFYRLNCLTRKDHGLPPQPENFFNNLHHQNISKKKGQIFLANVDGKPIAGAVFASFDRQAIYKYGASDKAFQVVRANNLVMWEAIKAYSKNGAKTFDFGRTELDHKGLMQFKRGWGTREGQIHYYHYDIPNHYFIKKYPKIKSSYFIFNKMPIPLLKLVGRVLYRHIA
jgi:hypothetical protein